MARRLTAEEADKVSQHAREAGDRPTVFVASTGEETEISTNFEVYLIVTDVAVRTQVANFFQVILDNDPNNLASYSELLLEFLEEEISNSEEGKREFAQVTEFYDTTRDAYTNTIDGFSDVGEVTLLQEALTNSLGPLAEQRDRFIFNVSALSVLQARATEGGSSVFRQELESWIRVLVEYE